MGNPRWRISGGGNRGLALPSRFCKTQPHTIPQYAKFAHAEFAPSELWAASHVRERGKRFWLVQSRGIFGGVLLIDENNIFVNHISNTLVFVSRTTYSYFSYCYITLGANYVIRRFSFWRFNITTSPLLLYSYLKRLLGTDIRGGKPWCGAYHFKTAAFKRLLFLLRII